MATGEAQEGGESQESFVDFLGEMGGVANEPAGDRQEQQPPGQSPDAVDYTPFEQFGLSQDQLKAVPPDVLGKLSEALAMTNPAPGMMPGPFGMASPMMPMPGLQPYGYGPQAPFDPMQQPQWQQQQRTMEADYAGVDKFELPELNEAEYGPQLRSALAKMNDHYHNVVVQMEAAIGDFYQQFLQVQQQERSAWVQEKISGLGDEWRTVFGQGYGSTPWHRHYRQAVARLYDQLASSPQFGAFGREQLFDLALQYAMPDQYTKVKNARSAKQLQQQQQRQANGARPTRTHQTPAQTPTPENHLIDEFGLDSAGIREVLAAQRQMQSASEYQVFGG